MFSDFWTLGKFWFILEIYFFSIGLENVGAAIYLTPENLFIMKTPDQSQVFHVEVVVQEGQKSIY